MTERDRAKPRASRYQYQGDETDERLVRDLLHGNLEASADGSPGYFSYPQDDAERHCRAALVRMLTSGQPLNLQILHALARLFEPPEKDNGVDRRLVFARRRGSQKHGVTRVTNMMIGGWIAQQMRAENRTRLSKTIEYEARDRFKKSRSTIRDVWSEYQKKYPDWRIG
jgi:hypothetical protein